MYVIYLEVRALIKKKKKKINHLIENLWFSKLFITISEMKIVYKIKQHEWDFFY